MRFFSLQAFAALFNSRSSPRKLLPQSVLISFGVPRRALNCRKVLIKVSSVSNEGVISRVDTSESASPSLWREPTLLYQQGAEHINSYVGERESYEVTRHLGRGAICWWSCGAWPFLQTKHLLMIFLTNERALQIQNLSRRRFKVCSCPMWPSSQWMCLASSRSADSKMTSTFSASIEVVPVSDFTDNMPFGPSRWSSLAVWLTFVSFLKNQRIRLNRQFSRIPIPYANDLLQWETSCRFPCMIISSKYKN